MSVKYRTAPSENRAIGSGDHRCRASMPRCCQSFLCHPLRATIRRAEGFGEIRDGARVCARSQRLKNISHKRRRAPAPHSRLRRLENLVKIWQPVKRRCLSTRTTPSGNGRQASAENSPLSREIKRGIAASICSRLQTSRKRTMKNGVKSRRAAKSARLASRRNGNLKALSNRDDRRVGAAVRKMG